MKSTTTYYIIAILCYHFIKRMGTYSYMYMVILYLRYVLWICTIKPTCLTLRKWWLWPPTWPHKDPNFFKKRSHQPWDQEKTNYKSKRKRDLTRYHAPQRDPLPSAWMMRDGRRATTRKNATSPQDFKHQCQTPPPNLFLKQKGWWLESLV